MRDERTITRLAGQFGLNWQGKEESFQLACEPARGRLLRASGLPFTLNTGSSENLIIESDNLAALKLLLVDYRSKIGVIYIDPPYNTGNDFGYSDNYRQTLRGNNRGGPRKGLTYGETGDRLHARWLSMMLPRLLLARELLRDDGLICISIDDNEIDKLRLVMAEVFGEDNFLGQITVLSNPRGRQAEKHFATVHEYLLVFAKDADCAAVSGVELTAEQTSEFKHRDPEGRHYRLLGLRQRGSASRKEDRPALHYPIFVDPETGRVSLERDHRYCEIAIPKKSTGQLGRWMWGKERLSKQLSIVEARLIAHRNEWDVFVRDFLDNAAGQRTRKVSTVWFEKELNYQNGKKELKSLVGEAPVDYPKPVALIKKAIQFVGDPESIVLDFFAGTGTTAQAVLELNVSEESRRKFILIQSPEPLKDSKYNTISELCIERVRQCARKLGSSEGSACNYEGFEVLHVSSTEADVDHHDR